jgi:predicted CopG family antitoxin
MARTKTIAVTEDVWDRLKQIMKREGARSMNEALTKIIERGSAPRSRFGVDRKRRIKYTQGEHEEFTADRG